MRSDGGLIVKIRHASQNGMSSATLSTKGQFVIPTRFRKALSLQPRGCRSSHLRVAGWCWNESRHDGRSSHLESLAARCW